MAYAVLRFANSSQELPVVVQAVDELIAEHLAAHAQLSEAMRQAIRDRDKHAEPGDT